MWPSTVIEVHWGHRIGKSCSTGVNYAGCCSLHRPHPGRDELFVPASSAVRNDQRASGNEVPPLLARPGFHKVSLKDCAEFHLGVIQERRDLRRFCGFQYTSKLKLAKQL